MARSVDEWIGKTDDTKIPPRVRLRVFERFNGVCQLSGIKIRAGDQWDCDHIKALINGGEHRESNLQPVLRSEHRKKTAEDVKAKAKDARVRKKHLGLHKPKSSFATSRNGKYKAKIGGGIERREK